MFNTLRAHILGITVGIILPFVGAVSLVTIDRLNALLLEDAFRLVTLSAKTHQIMLIRSLQSQKNREKNFINRLDLVCKSNEKEVRKCVTTLLHHFVETENAQSALLKYKNLAPIIVGNRTFLGNTPPTDQLAAFHFDQKNQIFYVIQEKSNHNKLMSAYYNSDFLNEIFENPSELGTKGETFLLNSDGQFMTPARFPKIKGEKSSLATKECLAGKNGSMVTKDYRGIPSIQAFRYIPEIGGGCIKALAVKSEVLAPLTLIQHELLGAILILTFFAILFSFVLSGGVLSSLKILSQRISTFERGDLDSPILVQGPSEIQQFARVFISMSTSIRTMIQNREEFLAVVSHDLKNPIANIQLCTGLVEKATEAIADPKGVKLKLADYARKISESCLRMQNLINDLLDLAKIEAGYLSIEKKSEDALSIVTEASEFFQSLALEKSISLEVQATKDRFFVFCDRDRIFQVMSNLIGNALKFTPSGGQIMIGVDHGENEGLFFVKDSGPGIPSESIQHIFDRFWQAKDARKKGSGLGLYISQRIILAHDGRIWVESTPGQGATFRFSIPQFSTSH